jgi:hypothetical protein
MSDGWLYVEHEETGGTARIPDAAGVREWNEARGWRVVDEPEPPVGLPPNVNADPDTTAPEWVDLVHPLTGATHAFPNNSDALTGASEAGWVAPNKDGSVPKVAQRKAAREAGVDVADLPDTAPEEPAGDTAGAESDQPAESSATNEEELTRG